MWWISLTSFLYKQYFFLMPTFPLLHYKTLFLNLYFPLYQSTFAHISQNIMHKNDAQFARLKGCRYFIIYRMTHLTYSPLIRNLPVSQRPPKTNTEVDDA